MNRNADLSPTVRRSFRPVSPLSVHYLSGNAGGLVRGIVPHLATKKPPIALTDYEELNS